MTYYIAQFQRMKKILAAFVLGLTVFAVSSPSVYAEDFNKGPLNMFPREHMFCGRKGFRFPVLVWGERDVNVCVLKSSRTPRFGGSLSF